MEAEASPIVTRLGLISDMTIFPSKSTPFKAYRGSYKDCNLVVITNGKDNVHGTGVDNCGTVPAALCTFLALQRLNGVVDIVINAGTCGGFQEKGARIGDVYLTTASAYHDRRIPIDVPDFVAYGIGRIESLPVHKLSKEINAKMGVCTTGNSLDKHDIDDQIMRANNASVKDMESAAISWACRLHDIPHFGVKVVTDIVDGSRPTEEEFLENLHHAAQELEGALSKIIEYCCGRSLDEL